MSIADRPEQSMADVFQLCDELGPAKVLHILEPALGLRAILVVDNVASGPAIGGVRMAEDVSLEECFRLARTMTLKNAAAGLPHGGGKSVIFGDPKQPVDRKEQLVRACACAIGPVADYVPGPDMGTDETCMAWIKDEIGRAVGLPSELGGIPLDKIGATGFGLAVCAETVQDAAGMRLQGARVVVQGFGSVGRYAARCLADKGAVLVAASDSTGAIIEPDGLDVAELIAIKDEGGHVTDYPRGRKVERDAVIDVECAIWIPAARPDVICADNVDRLCTELVLQGANIPVTPEAEARLQARGILTVPDFIANAGGVICAAVEPPAAYPPASAGSQAPASGAHGSAGTARSIGAGRLPRAPAGRARRALVFGVETSRILRRWNVADRRSASRIGSPSPSTSPG
jgi:glutamate dehydrogenase/leucine dehydrogenase